jgi:glycosyltransferase involved in cell wall biosynthesis
MARIVYLIPTSGMIQGGYKVILRHVESLRRLGFDAYCLQGADHNRPNWLDHSAPFIRTAQLQDADIIVSPDDAAPVLRRLANTQRRLVVLAQNPYYFALRGMEALDAFEPERLPTFLAVSAPLRTTIRRLYPGAAVHVVPCFADERLFRTGPSKIFSVAASPKKRPLELRMIQALFRKLHPRHDDLKWVMLEGMREPGVAAAMAEASLFLSLSRLESVGMTTLEAMASGCVCTGFLGVGGRLYATPENGLWVADDDCEAAADALARAADMVRDGSGAHAAYLAAGERTAKAWSHRQFEAGLEAFWSRFAPEARSGDASP